MNVIMETINLNRDSRQSLPLCPGTVAGARVLHHTIPGGQSMPFDAGTGYWHILLLVEGRASFTTGGETYEYGERISFVPALDQPLSVKAVTPTQLLEIQWDFLPGDQEELDAYQTPFPLVQTYADAKQYRDRNKSEKTISRVVLEQRNVPRFCMGSVESYGYDYVKPHGHPMLDQYFFSFPENDMDVIIDGEHVPMGGNVLLYIPLGSVHGVEVTGDKHMHYMWIDFMVDDTAMDRLDTSHIATGTMRSFGRDR